MTRELEPRLAAHLERHARRLHRIACGLGRQRDADDIVQTLYARWWRRMTDEPDFALPETHVELFVCVRRAALDAIAKEARLRANERAAPDASPWIESPEDSLHAFERLEWILSRLPDTYADVLRASLSAGRNQDATVAHELGLTPATFTTRLFKARRAAEELASFFDRLPLSEANLMAELRYGGKPRWELARALGLTLEELTARVHAATASLEKSRKVAS